EDPVPARRALGEVSDPAAVLLRVFTLGAGVDRDRLETALPSLGVAGARQLGIIGLQDTAVRATVDLSPDSATAARGATAWWSASDRSELASGAALGPDHVLGVGGASLTLARITPREPVGRALDLGCGGGIQALHAARHAEHVVA